MKQVSSSCELPFAADAAFLSTGDVVSRLVRESRDGAVTLSVPVLVRESKHLAEVSVPIEVTAGKAEDPHTLPIGIEARAHDIFFPRFRGALDVQSMAPSRSVLRLRGTYEVPFGWVGERLNDALVRGCAEASLRALVERIAAGVRQDVADRAHRNHLSSHAG
jgi:hypothetical protein